MKILHIIDALNSGGKERQLIELLKGLKKDENLQVEVVILSDNINYKYVFDLKTKLHTIKRNYKKDISIYGKLYKICNKFKPDVIHSWELMCSVYAIPIAKLLGAKFVNGMIRYSPSNLTLFNSKLLILSKFTFLLSDYVLSNSYAGLSSYNVHKYDSGCIHNGFDFNRIRNVNDIENIKNKHKITTKYIIGMVARFDKRKDYKMFIASAIDILQTRKDVTFLTVGDGETLSNCMDFVPIKYKEQIRFLGKQSEVESIINVFDIGVLVSYEEGISNSIMEYMALEKPVIATNHGGNAEIVINNTTGFLIKPHDTHELTEKIRYILDNRDIACAMGRHGRLRLEKEFSLEKMTNEYIKLYQSLIKMH